MHAIEKAREPVVLADALQLIPLLIEGFDGKERHVTHSHRLKHQQRHGKQYRHGGAVGRPSKSVDQHAQTCAQPLAEQAAKQQAPAAASHRVHAGHHHGDDARQQVEFHRHHPDADKKLIGQQAQTLDIARVVRALGQMPRQVGPQDAVHHRPNPDPDRGIFLQHDAGKHDQGAGQPP